LIVEAITMLDPAELRFAKTQQWYVAGASASLNAGVYALLRGAHLRCYEAALVVLFIACVAIGGTFILWQLQKHMYEQRRSVEINVPRVRSTDVCWQLTVVVLAVGFAAFYFLFVHPLSGRHLAH
jgi:hypothetical protein